MKKPYIFLSIFLTFFFSQAQIVNIPDANFKNTLVNTNCVDIDGNGSGDVDVDTNDDGEIQVTEALAVLGLNVESRSIGSLEGIQSFANLEHLFAGSNYIGSLNISQNLNLLTLSFYFNNLTSLDVSQNVNLNHLDISFNQIININLNNLENLLRLIIVNAPLETLDLSENLNLELIYARNNSFPNIDLSNNINLTQLLFFNNNLTELDLSQNQALQSLHVTNNNITNLDLSHNNSLTYLYAIGNNLESLNMKNGNNHNVYQCVTSENPDLFCIQVDDVEIPSQQNGWFQDPWTGYSLDCNLGIEENNLNALVNLYPNPVKDILRIDNINSLKINSVKIYDTLGRHIITLNDNVDQIDIAFLNSGVLFVEFETEIGNITKKIIKE
ncbi:MAG: T9SS type A sorting domain-containing protein [bacterium]|nr:T9SS type A sorting domain-containing protein [bacterium]